MQVEILRITADLKSPQLGVIRIQGEPRCLSLELPWQNNKPNISCIPEGTYGAVEVFNRKTTGGMLIPRTFEVEDVPGRSGILFHVGNTVADTRGCILTGMRLGTVNGVAGILSSREAFKLFLSVLYQQKKFTLQVRRI